MSRILGFLPGFYKKILQSLGFLTGLSVLIIISSYWTNTQSNWRYSFSNQIGEQIYDASKNYQVEVLGQSPNCVLVTDRSTSLSCLSPISGQVIWKNWLPESASVVPTYNSKYHQIIVATANGGVVGINEKTGQNLWNFTHPSNTHWEVVMLDDSKDNILALDRKNSFFVIKAETGQLSWSIIETQSTYSNLSYRPIGNLYHSGKLALVTDLQTGVIKAFDIYTGQNFWERPDAKKDTPSFTTLENGSVWYQTYFDKLVQVDSKTGTEIISLPLTPEDNVSSIPGLIQIFQNDGNRIRWYGNSTGELIREITLPGKIKTVWSQQGLFAILYFGPYQEKLAKINPKTGEIIWLSQDLGIINQTFQNQESIVITSFLGLVQWLDPKTGQVQASSQLAGLPTFIFNENEAPTKFFISVKHAGNYAENHDLNDILVFSSPGKLTQTWKDLAFDVSSGLLLKNRLWLIHQDLRQLISLSDKSQTPTQATQRSIAKPTSMIEKTISNLNFLGLKPNDLNVTAETVSGFRGCVVTWNISLNPKLKQALLKNQNLNLWKDLKITATVTSSTNQKLTNSGYYFQDYVWKAQMTIPDEFANQSLDWQIEYQVGPKKLRIQGKSLMPATCSTNVLKLQKNSNQLVDGTGTQFWGIGLQDIMADIDEDGSALDQWALGNTTTPPTTDDLANYVASNSYLKNYSESGFNLFRLGFDNFSYQLWHQIDADDLRLSAANAIMTDQLLQQLQDQNYYVIMSIFGFKPVQDLTNLPTYLDFLIARYGPWIDIWELSNEAWPDDEWVDFVSNYLKTHDPLNHPITISWERKQNPGIDLLSLHYYWNNPKDQKGDDLLFKLKTAKTDQKPVILSETGNIDASWDPESATRLRYKAWISAWTKTPIIYWNQSRSIYHNPDNANVFLGNDEKLQVNNLKIWLKNQQAENFKPISNSPQAEGGCIGMTNQQNKLLFYCLKREIPDINRAVVINLAEWTQAAQIDLAANTSWQASWFEPKTGLELSSVVSAESILTLPDFQEDLVVVWNKL